MPLSPPSARTPIHQRRILTEGFRREDGLWDLEAYLLDTKSYGFANQDRGWLSPGDGLHEMYVRLTINDELTVTDIEAVTDQSPFHICPEAVDNFQRIIGSQIGRGWRGELRRHLGKASGCTHLVEMLGVLGAVAFQTVYAQLARERGKEGQQAFNKMYRNDGKPTLLNTCYAFADNSPIAQRYWPDLFPPETGVDGAEDTTPLPLSAADKDKA